MSKKKNSNNENSSSSQSEAKKIWEEIKDTQINMFSLPDQTIEKYCNFIEIEPTKAYLTVKSASSVLVALENALGKNFNIVSASKFIIISRK